MNNPQLVDAEHIGNHCSGLTPAEKEAIVSCFSRAASTYNAVAGIQAQIAADARTLLYADFPIMKGSGYPGAIRVLDIGCGTGRESAKLVTGGAQITGLDIAPAMLEKARQDYPWLVFCEGDAEALPFEAGQFDAVFSSMALQWSALPQQALVEIARVLSAGGCAQLAIMVAGSFQELAQARSDAGLTATVNALPGALVWEKAVRQTNLNAIHSVVTTYTDTFADIRALLRSITKAGAGLSFNASDNVPMTRAQLKALDAAFSRNADGQLLLTYHVLHLSLEK